MLVISLPAGADTFFVATVSELETALASAQINGQSDTIYIAAGTYSPTVNLSYDSHEDFSIALVGVRGETVIEGGGHRILFMRTYTSKGAITLRGISFVNGYAPELSNGAGIFINSAAGDLTIEDCRITDCFAAAFYYTNHGGGAYITVGGTAAVIFRNCVIVGNTAKGLGGAMYLNLIGGTLYFINNTVIDNHNKTSVVEGGGGIYLRLYFDSARAHIYNNILWGNTYSQGNGDIYIEDNADGTGEGATVYVKNNDYGQLDWNLGGHIALSENISSDPLLTEDYRLARNSPCLDQGHASAPYLPSRDFNGDPRIKDADCNATATPDMGADEYSSSVTTDFITAITSRRASGGGTVADDGGHAITSRGLCYSTHEDPTVEDRITTDGSGGGAFGSALTGLSPDTAYFVRAYACSCEGVSYGNRVTFTSRPMPPMGTVLPLLLFD